MPRISQPINNLSSNLPNISCKLPTINSLPPVVPSRKTMAKTFDGPPTLERSGSEHRRAVISFLLRFLSPTRGTEGVVKTIEKAWLEVELSLQERRRGRKDSISPIQRPHYITSSYTYQFFEKNYICSPPQYRSALVATRMRKNALINMVHNY